MERTILASTSLIMVQNPPIREQNRPLRIKIKMATRGAFVNSSRDRPVWGYNPVRAFIFLKRT